MANEDIQWVDTLRHRGCQPEGVLGADMEGTVFELTGGRVINIWYRREVSELETLKFFYAAIAAAELPLTVPRILDVLEIAGRRVDRRVAKHEEALRNRLGDLAAVASASQATWSVCLRPSRRLCTATSFPAILMRSGHPSAILDFGFMSTIGDSAFDAAITASIYDMYGPDAHQNETRLEDAITERFGYELERLDTYRAAYALITAESFSPSGSDGHFDWCRRMLQRRGVRVALGI